jgi:hypothetical protein
MSRLPIDYARAAEIVCLANTPYYLYTHLCEKGFLYWTAERLSTVAILEWLQNRIGQPITEANHLVEVYVLLLSLTYKSPAEYAEGLGNLNAPHIEWFDKLAKLVLGASLSTSVQQIAARSTPTVASRSTDLARIILGDLVSTSRQGVSARPKPTVVCVR